MAELRRIDPEGYKKWQERVKNKPEFPERPSRNPGAQGIKTRRATCQGSRKGIRDETKKRKDFTGKY